MYAAAVSSGISPFDPRCARLYGREVCRGCLFPLAFLLGSGYNGLPEHPTRSSRNTKGAKPAKCINTKIKLSKPKSADCYLGHHFAKLRQKNQGSFQLKPNFPKMQRFISSTITQLLSMVKCQLQRNQTNPEKQFSKAKINEIESQYQKHINYQKRSIFSTKLRKPRNRLLTNTKLAPSTRTRLENTKFITTLPINLHSTAKKIKFFTILRKPSNHSHTNKKNKTEKYRIDQYLGSSLQLTLWGSHDFGPAAASLSLLGFSENHWNEHKSVRFGKCNDLLRWVESCVSESFIIRESRRNKRHGSICKPRIFLE